MSLFLKRLAFVSFRVPGRDLHVSSRWAFLRNLGRCLGYVWMKGLGSRGATPQIARPLGSHHRFVVWLWKFSSRPEKTPIPPMNLRLGGPKLLVTGSFVFFFLQVTYDKSSNSSLHVTTSNVERFSWSLSRRGNAATWPSDRRLVAGPRSKWGPPTWRIIPFPWISMVYTVYVRYMNGWFLWEM